MAQFSGMIWSAQKFRIEINISGSTWDVLTGAGSVRYTGGEAPTTESATFDNSVPQVGAPRAPSIEIALTGFVATTSLYRNLIEKRDEQADVNFRFTANEQLLFKPDTNATAAITVTTGAVTIAGSGAGSNTDIFKEAKYGPGMALKIGSNYHVIKSISSTGAMVSETVSAVSAAAYSVVLPPFHQPSFAARIISFGNMSAEAEGTISASLTISPAGLLGAMKVGRP